MASIPETYHDVFEKRSFAHFATLMSSGHPQVTPVWVDYDLDPERVLVNTARGRQKEHDVARRSASRYSIPTAHTGTFRFAGR
jgi:hypothetical protein